MVFVYPLLLLFFLIDCKPLICRNENYLDIRENNPIKGLFVIFVYFSHFIQYLSADQCAVSFTHYFVVIVGLMGQLIVTMFFIYSGYGLFYKVSKDGENYISHFLVKRFIPVYIEFILFVCFFWVLNLILNKTYSLHTILLSFLGWENIGNSNWFMFDTFISYILFYLSFRFIKNRKVALILFTALIGIFIIILVLFKQSYWWNTIICLPLGMWLSYEKKIVDKLGDDNKVWIITISILVVSVVFLYVLQRRIDFFYIILSCFFSISVILIQMRGDFSKSKCFSFLGKHVFSIYMLQRLVLIILQRTIVSKYVILYCFLGLLFTIFFAYIIDIAVSFLKCKLWRK